MRPTGMEEFGRRNFTEPDYMEGIDRKKFTRWACEIRKKYTRAGVTSSLHLSIGHYAGGMKREP